MSAVYDAGALIAIDRGDREMWALYKRETGVGRSPITHGGVIGQVWRDGSRQARLAQALASIEVKQLGEDLGRAAGRLLAAARTSDVIDAALIVVASDGDVIYTSDPDDIAHLADASGLRVEIVPV